jgi:hypothetical protein
MTMIQHQIGLMCYSVDEASYLCKRLTIETDIYVAYPCVHTNDLEVAWNIIKNKRKISLTVDSVYDISIAFIWCSQRSDIGWSDIVTTRENYSSICVE